MARALREAQRGNSRIRLCLLLGRGFELVLRDGKWLFNLRIRRGCVPVA